MVDKIQIDPWIVRFSLTGEEFNILTHRGMKILPSLFSPNFVISLSTPELRRQIDFSKGCGLCETTRSELELAIRNAGFPLITRTNR